MENLVNLEQLRSFYSDKKVFITGHTGFKGAWLMAWLHILGARIKGYALKPEYENGLYNILQPLQIGESIIADIRDKEKLSSELTSFQPDYIFHLAAQPLVRRSYEIPSETFEVNVVGTANLLEAIIELEKKCTSILITTDKVYENKEKHFLYTEEDALGGYDPYSASKACTELVVSSFRNSFFSLEKFGTHEKALASVRAGNIIGGGDWSKDRIIPDIVRSLMQGENIQVRNPDAVRPWQHVLDPLAGYLLLGALLNQLPGRYSKAYNFGPLSDDHLRVRDLVDVAIRIWGSGKWENVQDPDQPYEAGLLQLDISRAMNELKWKPKLNSGQAIEWTINWYKQSPQKQLEYTIQQIHEYLNL